MIRLAPRHPAAGASSGALGWLVAWSIAVSGASGCIEDAPRRVIIEPGVAIGGVELGMTYDALSALLGELEQPSIQGRLAMGTYRELGIEVLLSTGDDLAVTDDAVVLAVGLRQARGVEHAGSPRPGQPRVEIERELGVAPEIIGDVHYYPAGFSVQYRSADDPDSDAVAVGVFRPYELAPEPPPMSAAE